MVSLRLCSDCSIVQSFMIYVTALCDLRLFMMREHLLSDLTIPIKVCLSLNKIKNSVIYGEFHRCDDYLVRTDEDDGSKAIHYDDSIHLVAWSESQTVKWDIWRQCEPCVILICWTTILIAQPCDSSTISILIYGQGTGVYIKLIRNLSAAKRRSSTNLFTRKIRARSPETFGDPRDQSPRNDRLFFSFARLVINLAYAKLWFFSCDSPRSIIHFLNNHFETR